MSACSKMPDIMAWYEKEGALDLNHIQGCADCRKEKESLADFYEAAHALKTNVPAIPKSIERRLNRLSASSIILEATRRSLNFWTAAAKIESILLLLMGLALIALLGRVWQPVHQNQPQSLKEISMPGETLEKSALPDLTQSKTESISSPASKTGKNTSGEKLKNTDSDSEVSQNASSDSFQETPITQESQSGKTGSGNEPLQTQPESDASSAVSAELSAQDYASIKPEQKDGADEILNTQDIPAAENASPESISEVSSNESKLNENETSASDPAASNEESGTVSVSLAVENAQAASQENDISVESGAVSEEQESDVHEHTHNDEEPATNYKEILESAADSLNSNAYQGNVGGSVLHSDQHYLTANQNAAARSRSSVGADWYPGMARMLPVFLGNGYILNKNESFHPFFKPALDKMNGERPKDAPLSNPKNTGVKKPLVSSLSFKDALKNNQNLEIPAYEDDSGNNSQGGDASNVQAVHLEDNNNLSEWKTNSQTEDIQGKKFENHPGISQDAIEKLGPGSKDKPHQKFRPPKDKGPNPPGGKAPKFKPPIGKAFNPPGSKTPLPPGGKGPPPPGGL